MEKKKNLEIKANLHRRLKLIALMENKSLRDVTDEAILKFLENEKLKNPNNVRLMI